jgi:ATP adenylyltransferase
MKKLWAPWRLSFILGPKSKGCIFCQLPKAKKDRENLILYRGRYHYVILNKFPYNNGHLMVVPYRHIKDLHRLSREENAEMMELCGVTARVLGETMGPQGYNLGMNLGVAGGAGIRDHLHMHVVPRWNGDTNYMPLLSDTKVLVEMISDTYDRLAPAIDKVIKRSTKRKRKTKK